MRLMAEVIEMTEMFEELEKERQQQELDRTQCRLCSIDTSTADPMLINITKY